LSPLGTVSLRDETAFDDALHAVQVAQRHGHVARSEVSEQREGRETGGTCAGRLC
jgi:hypothetical protein